MSRNNAGLLSEGRHYLFPGYCCISAAQTMPVATDTFRDSACPMRGIVILCCAACISSSESPRDSLPHGNDTGRRLFKAADILAGKAGSVYGQCVFFE